MQNTYSDSALTTPNTNPVVLNAEGYLDTQVYGDSSAYRYRITLKDSTGTQLWQRDDVLLANEPRYAITAAETSAGVTPSAYQYEPGDVRRYGADPTGVSSSTTAINAALSVNAPVFFYAGTYLASGLTQSHDFQRIEARGEVTIKKNANGTILACTGDNVQIHGIGFRGDASSPTYTGDGVTSSGEHFALLNCGVRWISGRPVLATGNHTQIIGTCDIYQTTDSSGTGYDITLGVSGTATLYHAISNIYTSHATGGVRFVDAGGQSINGSQFGKLTIAAGTSPAGVNGGTYSTNRILGAVEVEISSAAFAANAFSTVNIHFVSGTSGHRFDESNVLASGATLDDDSNESYVVDSRLIGETQAYTPTWTAVSVNPSLGNGTLAGYYAKEGRKVFFNIELIIGSTTTTGTGAYTFSLPFAPKTQMTASAVMLEAGVAYECGVALLASGVASFQVIPSEAPSGTGISPTIPFTWGTADKLWVSGTYYTD